VIDINRMKLFARVLGWSAVIFIAVLSLVPGDMRPHTGAPGPFEHVAAYLGTAGLLTVGYGSKRLAGIIVISLSFYSAIFEIAQTQIPGRNPAVADFVASSIGAALGGIAGWIFLKGLERILGSRSV
jgi:hypothetical protein